jgi:hypothetical protein
MRTAIVSRTIDEGTIVRMFMKPGEDPNVVCDKCKDDRRGKPWLGLNIIRGMKRNGAEYTNGTILDPRDGDLYSAMMTLTPDGQTLVVRGYLGISLLGKNQYWTRLPETAFNEIDPRFNPHPPPAPGRKPACAIADVLASASKQVMNGPTNRSMDKTLRCRRHSSGFPSTCR